MPQISVDTALVEPQATAQIGAGMREVRERLGWRLPDVAAQLRIRLPYLEAIERGDLAALPGSAYQTGFVRSYALILGLDPEEILRRFRAAGMGPPEKAELSFLAPVPDRAVPTGALWFILVLCVIGGYAGWYFHSAHEQHLAQAIPAVPPELAPLAVPPKPPAPKPAPVATPAPATATPTTAATKTASATPATPTTPATPAATAAGDKPAPAVVTSTTPPAGSPTILATADTWIEVKDPTGNILFSRVLHAGESWPVPDEPGLVLTSGNAGGTEISSGGKTSAPLGNSGAVVRDYQLTPPAPGAAPPPALPAPATPPAQTPTH
jgi:cytoskeleton protein RodZ